jgi:hypothetical protein
MDREKNDDERGLMPGILEKIDFILSRYMRYLPEEPEMQKYSAFLWDGENLVLQPIRNPVRVDLNGLGGIDEQKKVVIDNTKNFVGGGPANNILLWGERGTGKSSLIKAMLGLFAHRNLRVIQVYTHEILGIQRIYDIISRHDKYRFIIFIDDLSFEEDQTDYKEMKTIMDGGLAGIPENLLFYATSNRKHLISEKFSDRNDDEIRPSDTMEEKLSLSDRFGIRLGFYHFSQDAYLQIVDLYAQKYGIAGDAELHRSALQWSLEAGSRNGRTAEQFIRNLMGSKRG